MDTDFHSETLPHKEESPCYGWLKKAYAELLAIKRVVLLYPKSTLLWPLLLLSVILVVGVWGVTHVSDAEEKSARDRAAILALDASMWVQQLMSNAIAPVMLAAAMVSYNPHWPAAKSLFEGLAPVMLAQTPAGSVRVIQLVPRGVVCTAYPLPGNEGALGLNLFESGPNREGAIRTVADRALTLVGPTPFVQGGSGFIVRQPIFVPNVSADEDFGMPYSLSPACGAPCAYNATTRTQLWGFTSSLVDLDALLKANHSKLGSLQSLGYLYEMWPGGGGHGGEDTGSAEQRPIAASPTRPRDPVEVHIQLPNNEWVLRVAPRKGWSSKWYGGLLAGVVMLALATSLMLFAALVSWRRHQMLLEALVPEQIIQDLRHHDTTSPLYTCTKIRQTETPADLLLNMMGDLLVGLPPKLHDVVLIRTALLRNFDLFTPLNVRSQIKAADLDSEVAQALMQQLVGGRKNSFASSRQQLISHFGGGGGGGTADDARASVITASTTSYDVDTLAGALAFVLSPEALPPDSPPPPPPAQAYVMRGPYSGGGGGAAVAAVGCSSGGGGATAASVAVPSAAANAHSCPLLVRGPPLLARAACTTLNPLADVMTAPPGGGCVGDFGGGGGGCDGEEEGGPADGGGNAATVEVASTSGGGGGGGATAVVSGSGTTPTPRAASQPASVMYSPPAPAYASGSALLRSSAGYDDAVRSTTLAAVALPPLPPFPSCALQQRPPDGSQSSHRRRLSITAISGSGSGGGGVCASCGAPILLGPLPPPGGVASVATSALSATAAAAPSWLHGSGSGSGSTSKLAAVARRLRGVGFVGAAAARCPPSPSSPSHDHQRHQSSASAGDTISINTAAGGNGGSGGGGPAVRPSSRLALALALSQRERLQSRPFLGGGGGGGALVHSALPSFGSPTGCSWSPAPVSAGSGGGGSCLAATAAATGVASSLAVSVRRFCTTEGLDLHSTGEVPAPAVAAGAGCAEEVVRPSAALVQEVERVLAGADSWHFNAWSLRDASGGHALSALGFYLMQREGLMNRFQIKPVQMARLLRRLEAGYQDNPYHNAVHAADVLQTLHVLLHGAQLHVHYLDPLGLLAAYFAAIIHDYGHPGLTGDFLTATSHPLALRYNDRSPLENHHCAAAFELMKGQPSLDITGGMSPGERAAFRKMVIELVLATDMKQHFSILSHFNTVHRLAAFSHNQHHHHHQQQRQQQQQQQQQQQAAAAHPHPHPALQQQLSRASATGGDVAGGGGGGGGASSGSLPGGGSSSLVRHPSSNSKTFTRTGSVVVAVAAPNGAGNGNDNGNSSFLPARASLEVVAVQSGAAAATTTAAPAAAATTAAVTACTTALPAAAAVNGVGPPAPRPLDDTERTLSLQLALKCADIGNLGRELECYKRWVNVLEEEFFLQGDRERELGLPISPLSDRTKQGVSKSQIGFFDFVALPLVHAMAAAFPGAQPLLETLLANYGHWKAEAAASQRDSVPPPVAAVAAVPPPPTTTPAAPVAPAPVAPAAAATGAGVA